MEPLSTGYYAFQTMEDGLCEYCNKRDAVRPAAKRRFTPHAGMFGKTVGFPFSERRKKWEGADSSVA